MMQMLGHHQLCSRADPGSRAQPSHRHYLAKLLNKLIAAGDFVLRAAFSIKDKLDSKMQAPKNKGESCNNLELTRGLRWRQ